MLESKFQAGLKKDILKRFPDAIIMKNDPEGKRGIPDLTILHGRHWATLECKQSSNAKHRPNQDYYVDKMNDMSFSRFVSPDNKEEVLNDLEELFKT
jgi:hypothetical protein